MFCAPASDGTPMFTPNYAASKKMSLGLIDESFVLVANQVALDESLEMPLVTVHVDRQKHWKRL